MSYLNVNMKREEQIELYTQTNETDGCVEVIISDGIDEHTLIKLTKNGEVFFYPDAAEEIGLKSIVI